MKSIKTIEDVNNHLTLEKKVKQDRQDYETLCRLANEYPMFSSVDWYPDFNRLKKRLRKR